MSVVATGGAEVDRAASRTGAVTAVWPQVWRGSHHEHIKVYDFSRVRYVRNIVWTATISIVLASLAVLLGVLGAIINVEMSPIVEGAGLASISFGLAGLSDKFDPRSRARE